jgi:hypothetical protein
LTSLQEINTDNAREIALRASEFFTLLRIFRICQGVFEKICFYKMLMANSIYATARMPSRSRHGKCFFAADLQLLMNRKFAFQARSRHRSEEIGSDTGDGEFLGE